MTAAEQALIDEVVEAEAARCSAIEQSDFETVERIVGDDFTYTHSSGKVDGKANHLTSLRRRARTIERGPLSVRVYGDSAVTNGTLKFRFGSPAEGFTEGAQLEVMQVWVRRDGAWKLVAHQCTKKSEGE